MEYPCDVLPPTYAKCGRTFWAAFFYRLAGSNPISGWEFFDDDKSTESVSLIKNDHPQYVVCSSFVYFKNRHGMILIFVFKICSVQQINLIHI
jgi:hypothetical protein